MYKRTIWYGHERHKCILLFQYCSRSWYGKIHGKNNKLYLHALKKVGGAYLNLTVSWRKKGKLIESETQAKIKTYFDEDLKFRKFWGYISISLFVIRFFYLSRVTSQTVYKYVIYKTFSLYEVRHNCSFIANPHAYFLVLCLR